MNVARIGQTSSGADGHLKRSTKRASLQRPLQPETSRCKEAVATGREPVFLRTSPLGRTVERCEPESANVLPAPRQTLPCSVWPLVTISLATLLCTTSTTHCGQRNHMHRRLLRRRAHFSSKLTAQHARSRKFTNPHTKSSVAGFCAPLGAALLPIASPALSAAEQWSLKSQSEAHPGICPSYEPRGKPHAETARSGGHATWDLFVGGLPAVGRDALRLEQPSDPLHHPYKTHPRRQSRATGERGTG